MKKNTIIAGIIFNLLPVALWIILGVATGQKWYFYVLCGVLSVTDIINTITSTSYNIRTYLHNRKGI